MLKTWLQGIAATSLLFAGNAFAKKVDFTKDLMPLFEERCIKCHGHIKESGKVVTKGDLDLTKPESIKETFEAGKPKVVLGLIVMAVSVMGLIGLAFVQARYPDALDSILLPIEERSSSELGEPNELGQENPMADGLQNQADAAGSETENIELGGIPVNSIDPAAMQSTSRNK